MQDQMKSENFECRAVRRKTNPYYTHIVYSNVVLDRVLIVISLDRISTNLDWIKLNLHFPLCNVYDIYTWRIPCFSYGLMKKSENLMKTSEFLMISLVFHWKSKYSISLSKNTTLIFCISRYLSLKLLGTYLHDITQRPILIKQSEATECSRHMAYYDCICKSLF